MVACFELFTSVGIFNILEGGQCNFVHENRASCVPTQCFFAFVCNDRTGS